MDKEFTHKPVLLDEVVSLLSPKAGKSFLDVTLGLGGHTQAILKRIGSAGLFVGIDADSENLHAAREQMEAIPGKKKYIHANFIDLPTLNLPMVDMILADLGMSSVHVDDASRGFTFQKDVPLDLRFDRTSGATAAEMIENASEQRLADILYKFGELRQSRKLAAALKQSSIETTGQLKDIVTAVFGYKANDLLPQVFQALRIAVNGELDALKVLLEEGPRLLKSGGRMAVISFHSLEDRMVKKAFRERCAPQIDDRTGQVSTESDWEVLTKKPITPSNDECAKNPRARSAKLRAIRKR